MDSNLTVRSEFMPALTIEEAIDRRNAIIEFTKRAMTKGTDYGAIPGTDKPTLLKPGAEKLANLFGLAPAFEVVETEKDWTGRNHDNEPFLYVSYKCKVYRGGALIAEGEGSCNSWETKYRYRKAERVCPACGKDAIVKGKKEYGGGWLCFAKKGGCGAKYKDGDQAIEGQQIGQIPNPNPADLYNTIQKMAQKRALVAAILIAVNASEFFTQDVEDMPYIDAEWREVPTEAPPPPQQSQNKALPAPANGKKPRGISDYQRQRLKEEYIRVYGAVDESEAWAWVCMDWQQGNDGEGDAEALTYEQAKTWLADLATKPNAPILPADQPETEAA